MLIYDAMCDYYAAGQGISYYVDLVPVPGVAVGGDAVTGLGDQAGERTQQHTTGRTGNGAVRVGDRHLAVRARHVDRERRHFLNARAVAQVGADRHTREQVRGDDRV